MGVLLLALHLWQPAPATAAHLDLGTPLLNPGFSAMALAPSVPPASPVAPAGLALTPGNRLLAEAGGGALLYIGGELVAGIVTWGLIEASNHLPPANTTSVIVLDASLVLLVVGLVTAEVFGGPLLFAGGAHIAMGLLDEPGPGATGPAIVGGYIGAILGGVGCLAVTLLTYALDPSAASGSGLTAIDVAAIISGLLIPMGGGLGASIGLHWHDGELASEPPSPSTLSPQSPPPASPVPPVAPPSAPPPQAEAPHAISVTLFTLAFG